MLSVAQAEHVVPWAGLAAELARRGHQVCFTTTDQFADVFKGDGLSVARYASTPPPAITDSSAGSIRLWRMDEGSAIVDAAIKKFTDIRPNVILYDTTAQLAGRLLAQLWQVPAVALSANFATGPQYSLDRDITNRPTGKNYMPALGDFLNRMGSIISAHAPDLPVYSTLLAPWEELNLVAVPREFQIAGDTFPDQWVFTGPYLTGPAVQDQWQPPDDDPVLLVSLGDLGHDSQRGFLDTCVTAFAGLDWHVVLATGPQLDPAEFGPLPSNFEAHRQVPRLAVLENAKGFVSTGAMGGILEALSMGVPMVTFPQLPEHHIAADRLAELDLGRTGEPGISAGELKATVLALAADSATARALTLMREHVQKAGGATRAAEEIELHVIHS